MPDVDKPEWVYSDDEYVAMTRKCQRRIRAGDAYQLCLTAEISARVQPDPLDPFFRLRQLNPSHHGGFVRIGGVSLISSSPEQFLAVSASGRVEFTPMKGTRKRAATIEEDNARS